MEDTIKVGKSLIEELSEAGVRVLKGVQGNVRQTKDETSRLPLCRISRIEINNV